jgi:hypothetical protein
MKRSAYRAVIGNAEGERQFGMLLRQYDGIIKWTLKEEDEDVDCINMAQYSDRGWVVFKTVINLNIS